MLGGVIGKNFVNANAFNITTEFILNFIDKTAPITLNTVGNSATQANSISCTCTTNISIQSIYSYTMTTIVDTVAKFMLINPYYTFTLNADLDFSLISNYIPITFTNAFDG